MRFFFTTMPTITTTVIWNDKFFHKGWAAIKKDTSFFCGMEGKERGELLRNCLEKNSYMSLKEDCINCSIIFLQ